MKLFRRLREKTPEGDHILAIADDLDRVTGELEEECAVSRKLAEEIRSYDADTRKQIMVDATIRAIPHDPVEAVLEMVVQAV